MTYYVIKLVRWAPDAEEWHWVVEAVDVDWTAASLAYAALRAEAKAIIAYYDADDRIEVRAAEGVMYRRDHGEYTLDHLARELSVRALIARTEATRHPECWTW